MKSPRATELKKTFPEGYEGIIREVAIPYVESLHNIYHSDIIGYYELLRIFDQGYEFFNSEHTYKKFESVIKNIERAERILRRACTDTSIELPEHIVHDPQRILTLYLNDKLSKEPLSSQIAKASAKVGSEEKITKERDYVPVR